MPSALMKSTGVTLACVVVGLLSVRAQAQQSVPTAVAHYKSDIQPILVENCFACHGDGAKKGQVSLDTFKSDQEMLDPALWLRVLKNVRAGIMPPASEPRLKPEQMAKLEKWVKTEAFGIDPQNPDPGRVTLRRMNRTEYRNTIRDLMGFDFRVEEEFPPDDSGYGFDNIGDVLSVSPMLLEKYMAAAETIVAQAVPKVSRVVQERMVFGGAGARGGGGGGGGGGRGGTLSLKTVGSATQRLQIEQAGDYRLTVEVTVNGSFDFDPAKALMTFKVNDQELFRDNYQWQGGRKYEYTHVLNWEPGERTFTFDMQPLNVPTTQEAEAAAAQLGARGRPNTTADMRIVAVRVQGPLDEGRWIAPPNYNRFFTRADPPSDAAEKREYAREVLNKFATKAFRRPVDAKTLDRLVTIAEAVYSQPDKRFEHGVSQAMVAVLASPRFIFRTEMPVMAPAAQAKWAPIDEYALASRLSYFLWSTMPDDELFDLAAKGQLRQNQDAQFKRMLADTRSNAFVENFTGQWLQIRDIDTIVIDSEVVLARDAGTEAQLRADQEAARAGRGRGRGRGQQNQNQQQNQQQNQNPNQQPAPAQQNAPQAPAAVQQQPNQLEAAQQQVLQAQQQPAAQPNAAQAQVPPQAQPQQDPAQPQQQPQAQQAQGQPQQQPQANAQARGRGNRGRGNRGNNAPAAPTLDTPLRRAMRQETELYFNYVLREDRSALELLSSNYTFLNARLAQHYGIEGVQGQEMQRVELAPESPRGGILTHGAVLVVTSNTTRTSPVKRGLFILDNVLGTPAPPPPADVPEIEAAEKAFEHEPTMRELMQAHREKPLCNACHMRMDSLGLALENFNAMGMWRNKERGQDIDSSGQLITGENLKGVADLKKVLTNERRADFYTCLTEKVLTYALGRGLEHYDTDAVDKIVAKLEADGGKISTLLTGVVESVPFQKMRVSNSPPVVAMQE